MGKITNNQPMLDEQFATMHRLLCCAIKQLGGTLTVTETDIMSEDAFLYLNSETDWTTNTIKITLTEMRPEDVQ